MIIACPSCSTRFGVNAGVFPAAGRKVRCAKCGHVWHADHPAAQGSAARQIVTEPPRLVVPPAMPALPPELDAQGDSHVEPHAGPLPSIDDPAPELIWANVDAPAAARKAVRTNLWAGAAVMVAVVATGLIYFRQSIAMSLPATGPVYAAIGLPVDTTGLELQIEAHSMVESASTGVTTLVVTGKIANITTEDRPVPYISATLLGKDKTELHSWTFDPGVTTLKPGETHDFKQVVAQPPDDTYQVYAHFADAGG